MEKPFQNLTEPIKTEEGKLYQGQALKKQTVEKKDDETMPDLKRRRFLQKAGIATLGVLGLAAAEKEMEVAHKIGKLEKSLRKRKESKKKQNEKETQKELEQGNASKIKKDTFSKKESEISEERHSKDKHSKDNTRYLEKPKNINNPRDWCDFFLNKYDEISRKSEIYPPRIFNNDFFIAIQLTESGYNPESKSKKGASGLMQIMPSAIKDLPEFLSLLQKKNKIQYDGPSKFDKNFDKLVEEITQMGLANPDYNRAIGKLYLANLYFRYKIGKKEFKKGELKQAWKFLAAAYNQGASRTKKSENFWTKEARQYYKKVLNYIQRLDNINEHFQKNNLKTRSDYLRMLLAREMETVVASAKARQNKIGRYTALQKYLKAIKEKEEKLGRALNNAEVKQIVNSQNTFKIVFRKSLREEA